MIEYARLRPGRGFKPFRAAFYYTQRLFVAPRIRSAIIAGISSVINWRHSEKRAQVTPKSQTVSAVVGSLTSDGIAMLPEFPQEQIKEIQQFLLDKPLVLRSGETVSRDQIPPDCTMANYPLETVLRCPHLLATANSDLLIRTATQYLGCVPTISTMSIRWSFPGRLAGPTTHMFHRDQDDWRCVKFFTYLSDVDENSGPHLYVRRTHRTPLELFTRRFEKDHLERAFGRDSICAVTGRPGTSFMMDAHGIHAGPIPIAKPRLMFQVGYTVLPVFAFQYRPLKIAPLPPVDKYINRLIVC